MVQKKKNNYKLKYCNTLLLWSYLRRNHEPIPIAAYRIAYSTEVASAYGCCCCAGCCGCWCCGC